MCRFSEANRRKLGNVVAYIAEKAKYPYKTEVLKLLYLMEEQMVQRYHVPFLGIPFLVWRMGPVSVDVFEELSDSPVLLEDYIKLQYNGRGTLVAPKKSFDEDEFSNAELDVMERVIEKYGQMNSDELIEVTHRDGGLWKLTAEENGLLEDFDQRRANSSSVVIDMSRGLCPDDKAFYQETLEVRQAANELRN